MCVIGGDRMSINQDAMYRIIGWAGNMTMSNAALQGVLINVPATESSETTESSEENGSGDNTETNESNPE